MEEHFIESYNHLYSPVHGRYTCTIAIQTAMGRIVVALNLIGFHRIPHDVLCSLHPRQNCSYYFSLFSHTSDPRCAQ